jgi:tetratricopeptide (TPR) repeat protein
MLVNFWLTPTWRATAQNGAEGLSWRCTSRSTIDRISEVVARAPAFAEGWNKRATVHYLLNNLQQSLEDIAVTLKWEPRHFGALSGRGLVFIKLRDLEQAVSVFEEVLQVDPQMTSARANIDAIRKMLGQREI